MGFSLKRGTFSVNYVISESFTEVGLVSRSYRGKK